MWRSAGLPVALAHDSRAIEESMPITVRCDACHHLFRISEAMIGERVQCPECQTSFEVIAEVAEEGVGEEGAAREANRARWLQGDEEKDDADKRNAEEGHDDESSRRRRIKKARGLVLGPAIALMVASVLGLMVSAFFLFVVLTQDD